MSTLDSLMRHLRASGVHISGSSQKRKLKNLGYYHGYKGYRFVGVSTNRLPLSSFNEVVLISDFDAQLKTLFYPKLLFIETALKNYTLEAILKESRSEKIEDVWNSCLTGYRDCTGKAYKAAWSKRLRLRSEIDNLIYQNHNRKDVIRHFWEKDQPTPIWALFEVMTLGNFGSFFSCLKSSVKYSVTGDLNMPSNLDSPRALEGMIFGLKDLRNAVAHNGVVFDVRFKTGRIPSIVGKLIEEETDILSVDFASVTDYAIMILYFISKLGCSKTECKQFIAAYSTVLEKYRKELPFNIYGKIIETNSKKKLRSATIYIKQMN